MTSKITKETLDSLGFHPDRMGVPTLGALHIDIDKGVAYIRSFPIPIPPDASNLWKLLELLGIVPGCIGWFDHDNAISEKAWIEGVTFAADLLQKTIEFDDNTTGYEELLKDLRENCADE